MKGRQLRELKSVKLNSNAFSPSPFLHNYMLSLSFLSPFSPITFFPAYLSPFNPFCHSFHFKPVLTCQSNALNKSQLWCSGSVAAGKGCYYERIRSFSSET